MQVRITTAVAKVLKAFLEDINEERYGFELMQQAGLASGTLYPILARLESAGWIVGQLESIDPVQVGRPPRRFYTLTGEGAQSAHRELARLSAELRPPRVPGLIYPKGHPA
jgi:PadR family transcriptional regulator PadR